MCFDKWSLWRRKQTAVPKWSGDIARFEIEVIRADDWDRAVVRIKPSDPHLHFGFWMCACEYFMRVTAQMSSAEFSDALEFLVEGAHEYREAYDHR